MKYMYIYTVYAKEFVNERVSRSLALAGFYIKNGHVNYSYSQVLPTLYLQIILNSNILSKN